MKTKIRIYGIKIDNISMSQAVDKIIRFVRKKKKGYLVTPNADHLTKIPKDQKFKEAYGHASMVLADGMPLVWASRLLGRPIVEKVSGSDLFLELLRAAEKEGLSVFFLGSPEGSSKKGVEIIRKMHPKLRIAGRYSPPMYFERDAEENNRVISRINKTRPDLLFIFLSPPRQEIWIYDNIGKLKIHMALCVGASLDYISGWVKRAPLWMQNYGLEWTWRMFQNPKRLMKRYLIDDMFPFIWLTLKEFFKR